MLRKLIGTTALFGLLAAVSAGVSAAPIVTNGSFENGLTAWSQTGSGTTPGQHITVVTTGGTNSTGYNDNVPNYDGTHAAYFVDDNAVEDLFQSINLSGSKTYSLSFALFATQSGANNPFNFTLEDSNGNQVLNTFTNSTSGTQVPVGVWTPQSSVFSVASAGAYRLNFHFTSGLTPAKDVLLDGVAVNEVPEPMSLALLGAGLLGMGAMRRMRSHNAH